MWQGRLSPTVAGLMDLIHRLQDMCRGYEAQIAQQAHQVERQMDLIEQQNEVLLKMKQVYEERLEEAAIFSFSLDHENIELRQRVRQLEEQLARNSGNSSLPPSANRPGSLPVKGQRRRSKLRRGGQLGHAATQRALVPPEQVDVVVECKPERCGHCEATLQGEDAAPRRHQVVEIPEPKVHITEYRLHRLICPDCGRETTGELPAGVSQSPYGPRVHALTALLSGRFLLSKRETAQLFELIYGLEMSPSSVIAMERRMSRALEAPVNDAVEWIRRAAVVHPDETSWRQEKRRAWLWTAATEQVVVFRIQRRRNQAAAKELLGEDFTGTVCADRFGAYNWIDKRGYCWAHLKRDFQAMAERFGSEWYGCRLVAGSRRVMHIWREWHEGRLDRQTMDQQMAGERERLHRLLVSARERAPAPKTRRECAVLLRGEDCMWTFLEVEGMPPTNNLAERCLRRAVLWRKKSFGTDSEAGSRFVERILTVTTTLQQQHRPVLDFLVDVRTAHLRAETLPSLTPSP